MNPLYTLDDIKKQMFLTGCGVKAISRYFVKGDGSKGCSHNHLTQILNGTTGASPEALYSFMLAISECSSNKGKDAEKDTEE